MVTRDKTAIGTLCLLPPSHLQPCVLSTVTTHLLELSSDITFSESDIPEFTEGPHGPGGPPRVGTKYKCLCEDRVGAQLTRLPGSEIIKTVCYHIFEKINYNNKLEKKLLFHGFLSYLRHINPARTRPEVARIGFRSG